MEGFRVREKVQLSEEMNQLDFSAGCYVTPETLPQVITALVVQDFPLLYLQPGTAFEYNYDYISEHTIIILFKLKTHDVKKNGIPALN